MRTSLVILAMCICGLIGGLLSYGWAQATADIEVESKLIKSVIDQATKAWNSRDLSLMLAQYADDAKIDSKAAGAKVSKPVYAEAMSRHFQRLDKETFIEVCCLKISLVDATHAVAEGTLYVNPKDGGRIVSRHEWKLEKRDGRWLIVETNYK